MYRIPSSCLAASLAALALSASAVSLAGDVPDGFVRFELPVAPSLQGDAPAAEEDASKLALVDNDKERNYDMEVSFRGRMVSVPKTILDIWYFDQGDEGWPLQDGRPRMKGYGLGLEFVVKSKPRADGVGGANGIFYFDWLASSMKEGYWDDVEEPPQHSDGDYIKPSSTLGLLSFGADYGYEVHMVKTAKTNGNFGLSMLVGGGLGVSYMVGNLERWGPKDGVPGYERYFNGEPPDGDKRIPKVFPMVDVNLGLRFNFGDRLVIRFEGGLHTLVYYGATLGIMF